MFFQINSESERHSFREIQQSSEGRQIPKLRAFSQVVVNQTIALQTGFLSGFTDCLFAVEAM